MLPASNCVTQGRKQLLHISYRLSTCKVAQKDEENKLTMHLPLPQHIHFQGQHQQFKIICCQVFQFKKITIHSISYHGDINVANK